MHARKRDAFSGGDKKLSGLISRNRDLRPWAGLWQLSECVYLSPALGFIRGKAAFRVSRL
jgi:hypothetical protein